MDPTTCLRAFVASPTLRHEVPFCNYIFDSYRRVGCCPYSPHTGWQHCNEVHFFCVTQTCLLEAQRNSSFRLPCFGRCQHRWPSGWQVARRQFGSGVYLTWSSFPWNIFSEIQSGTWMDGSKAVSKAIKRLLDTSVVKPQLLARPIKGATPLILQVEQTFLRTESFRCILR